MRTVYDETLKQHAGDLLLDRLGVRLGEQVEQRAAEVVRVRVRVSHLVGDRIQKQVASFGVQIDGQILEDVHV